MKIVVTISPLASAGLEESFKQPCPEAHEEVLETICSAFKPRKEWVVDIKSLQHLAQFINKHDSEIESQLIISDTGYKGILFAIEFYYIS